MQEWSENLNWRRHMKTQTTQNTHIADIRRLANAFDGPAIAQCMQLALTEQANPCYSAQETSETINVLAKTGFVVGQMQQGLTLAQALRELGRRMRAIQGES